MRKRNKVKQLNRVTSHRKAMMRNLASSLFDHERIVTTRARTKVLRSYAEKLITRAKNSLSDGVTPEKALHNKREVMKHIKDRAIVAKLFEEIAPRYKDRSGGYTRIIHLHERKSDSAEMSIIELVDRKEKIRRVRADSQTARSSGKEGSAGDQDSQSSRENSSWYKRLMRRK